MTDKKYYQLPIERWQSNYAVELNVKTAQSGKSGKGFKANYVPYHDVQFALRKHEPDLVFEIDEFLPIGDEDSTSYLILCHLYHQPTGLSTPIMRYPVMRHGVGQHAAVENPTAREISDSIKRAFVRCVAEETGLGYSLWVQIDNDPEDEPEESAKKSRRKKQDEFKVDWDDDDSLDDDDNLDDDDDDDLDDELEKPRSTRRVIRRGGRRG